MAKTRIPQRVKNFYPRSPCGERPWASPTPTQTKKFLSTLSLRRATVEWRNKPQVSAISIHALLAESDCNQILYRIVCHISIHALLAESDALYNCDEDGKPISIHALLAESDRGKFLKRKVNHHFYPRSPCGERLNFIIFDPSA